MLPLDALWKNNFENEARVVRREIDSEEPRVLFLVEEDKDGDARESEGLQPSGPEMQVVMHQTK